VKQILKSASALVLVASLAGCGEPPLDSAAAEKLHYTDPAEQQRLKRALQSANLPFETHKDSEGREEIWYESRFRDQVTQIRDELFGVPPPMGRSISLGGERNAAFVEELKKRNASYWSVTYRDLEFIAWPPGSDEAADVSLEVIGANPYSVIERKKMREAADAEARDRTSRSSRSRVERAAAER
jgi:predicted small lipoprotein YifL